MANFIPFKALRPKAELSHQVSDPPYDVLKLEEAQQMIEQNSFTILKATRPDAMIASDPQREGQSEYEVAYEMFNQLKKEGLLEQEKQDCYHIYAQQMGEHTQYGMVGLCSVDDYWNNVIKKHEHTQPKKENDRMKHVKNLKAHLGPVLMTYRSNRLVNNIVSEAIENEPEIEFTASDQVAHKIWTIRDPKLVKQLQDGFKSVESIYIADGHHRTAAAAKVGKDAPNTQKGYFLAVLFPDDQMQILPYNRVVKNTSKSAQELINELEDKFYISETERSAPERPKCFHAYIDEKWYLLELKSEAYPKGYIDRLDVSILQQFILEPVFGISDPRTDFNLLYVGGIKSLAELEEEAKKSQGIAFSMYPTQLHEIFEIADSGNVMPPKSTWFEPKLRSGLFISQY